MNRYKTIAADPPWPEQGAGKIKRGADRHYPSMKVKEIIAMGDFVKSISENNSHLYLWVTNNHLEAGMKVMAAWGFRYVTMITWAKPSIGLGQYFRGTTEHCLFGVRGKVPYKMIDGKRQQGRTHFEAPRTKHSEKPMELYEMAEKVSYEPRIELFARKPREGWSIWGNEVGDEVKVHNLYAYEEE